MDVAHAMSRCVLQSLLNSLCHAVTPSLMAGITRKILKDMFERKESLSANGPKCLSETDIFEPLNDI